MSNEDKYKQVFNPKAFVGVKKADFKNDYKGKLPFDLDSVWEWICNNRGSTSKKD